MAEPPQKDASLAVEPRWPHTLWLARHGESAGNLAHAQAEAARSPTIAIPTREVEVPLSPRGETQARALGRWLGAQPEASRPTVVMTSPFTRAAATAQLVIEAMGGVVPRVHVSDERLRERDLGALDRLTRRGIAERWPEEAARRAQLGKFYYRPPGGESWCDVILRLRSVLDHVQLRYRGERVLLVAHQVVVLCFRYLLEGMTEPQLLAIDAEADVANCSLTTYSSEHAGAGHTMVLRGYNVVVPLEREGAPVTAQPDATTEKP